MNLFKSLHSIIFHSKGAYDYYTIYNMPIWLRKFTFKEIQDFYANEKKSHDAATKGKGQSTLVDKDGKVNVPAFAESSKQYRGKTGYK